MRSDDSDDEETGGGVAYDYELETAKKAQAAAVDGISSGEIGIGRDTMEGMTERLQAETEVCLARVFRGGEGQGGASKV